MHQSLKEVDRDLLLATSLDPADGSLLSKSDSENKK